MRTARARIELDSAAHEAPARTVSSVAADCLAQADGNVLKATDLFVQVTASDHLLYRELMDPLHRSACYAAVTSCCRTERGVIWNAPQPSVDERRGQVIALAKATENSLMNFPLPGGLRLGDAGRQSVLKAAEFYGKQSRDMGAKAIWLQLVAQSVTGTRTVRQCLTDDRLVELRTEAERPPIIEPKTTKRRRKPRRPS
jgi:hypothetical protein